MPFDCTSSCSLLSSYFHQTGTYENKGADRQRGYRVLAHLSRRLIGVLKVYRRRRPSSSFTISNIFSSETAWPIKVKFSVEPHQVRGPKVCSWYPGHMTKMVASPYMLKPFKNLLLRNWLADFHETWHVASGTPVHHSLFK